MTDPKTVAQRFAWEKSAMVPKRIINVARQISEQLKERGIAHAVAGGMAVSMHGYNRTTEDVDFLVPKNAKDFIESLGVTTPLTGYLDGLSVKVNKIDVDFLFLDKELKSKDLSSTDHFAGLPVVKLEPLIVMKIGAGRLKDSTDVVELLKLGKVPVEQTMKRLRKDDQEDFKSLIQLSELEKHGGDTRKARRSFLARRQKL